MNIEIIFKQYRGKIKRKIKDIVGWDTECDKSGKAIIIANSDAQYAVITKPNDIFNFMESKRWYKCINLLWNINFDFQAIAKWLGQKRLKELAEYGSTNWNGYKIRWVKDKMFRIYLKKYKRWIWFFDLYQFYGMSLAKASKIYLGIRKYDISKDIPNMIERGEIRKPISACIQHAYLTKLLGIKFNNDLQKYASIYYDKWYSMGKLAEILVRQHCYIPIWKENLEDTRFIIKAYRGGWVELYKRGRFENIYKYDINSAYPYQILFLRDFYPIRNLDHADYGTVEVEIEAIGYITYPHFRAKNMIILPNGNFKTWLTVKEYRKLKEDGYKMIIKRYKVYKAYGDYLFKDLIYFLYLNRKRFKILKLLLNSIYGKFIQIRNGVTGNLFNPIWASEITAGCRLQIYDLLKKIDKRKIIGVATDCIFLKGDVQIDESNEIGRLKKEYWKEGIFIHNGIYTLRGGDDIYCKNRGFRGYLNLFEILEQNYDKDEIQLTQQQLITIKQTLRQIYKFKWEDVNKFINQIKKINFFYPKRVYPVNLKAKDFLVREIDSFPHWVQIIPNFY